VGWRTNVKLLALSPLRRCFWVATTLFQVGREREGVAGTQGRHGWQHDENTMAGMSQRLMGRSQRYHWMWVADCSMRERFQGR